MRLVSTIAAILVLFALAHGAVAQVRYSVAELPAQAPPSARAAGLRLLTWPGKVEPQAARSAANPSPPPSYRPYGAGHWAAAQAYQPPLNPYQPAAPPLPDSIYAPPPAEAPPAPQPAISAAPAVTPGPAPAQPARLAAAGGETPRFYSLHRPYGETPDPVTLDPQFLDGASQDLADPPPLPPRSVTTSTGRVIQQQPADAATTTNYLAN